LKVEVMFDIPCPALIARPVLFTIAIVGFEDFHCEMEVMSCDVPSSKLPVAVNCCTEPKAMDGASGVTDTLTIEAPETISVV
jgi:hypothetical protein